ncbi:MAG: DUF371 domain-containing protein [Candidatus Methanofastidiosum sp.]|nr:DUF371 domain-containing protein [Methanofastidiosum sp.]
MISFTVKGHPKISAEHRSTLEFTKQGHISGNGDCILGISSDHDIGDLNKLNGRLVFVMNIDEIEDSFEATIPKNHEISDKKELVIRTSSFVSSRTYAIGSTKASIDIDRELIQALKEGKEMKVSVYEKPKSMQ